MNTHLLEPIMPVLDEANQLVRTAWALQSKAKQHLAHKGKYSDEEWALEYSCLDALRREVISSLCRLDDPASGYFSLRHAVDHICSSGCAPERAALLRSKVRLYRDSINPLKVSHRNSYIGHLTERGYTNQYGVKLFLTDDLRACVLHVLAIVDLLCGDELGFVWPIRNSNELINLRFPIENPHGPRTAA